MKEETTEKRRGAKMHLPSCHRSNRFAKKPRGTFRWKKNYPFFGACSFLRGIGEPSSHYQRKRLVIPVAPLDAGKRSHLKQHGGTQIISRTTIPTRAKIGFQPQKSFYQPSL